MSKREYIQANKEWLEAKSKEEGVKALPKGVYYKVLAEGNADSPQPALRSIIIQHPDWTNEAIAEHCGFTDRSAFQNKFKEKTGMTPTEFAQTAVAQDRS